MVTSAEQMRAYRGPAVLSYGFRPFFLGGSIWAAVAMVLWLLVLSGRLELPSALAPLDWHVHELLYGYLPAVMAGFLLTAIPNWTGGLPVVGTRLLALFAVWIAGRLAMLLSAWLAAPLAAVIDLGFLALLASVIAREIVAAGNTRNLKVLMLVALMLIGNAVFHLEAVLGSDGGYGKRIGIAGAVLLIMLIGGRIVPSFTRNWLVRRGPGRLPLPFAQFDAIVMAASAVALLAWGLSPEHAGAVALAAVASALNVARLGRWVGYRTFAEPLVLVLHAGFAFVPIGFAMVALAGTWPGIVQPTGALHAWTVGAIGIMTLAVMTRASLGHTGRALTASAATIAIYVAALLAATARLLAAFHIESAAMLTLSGAAWIAAFGGFAWCYGPLLTTRRADQTV